MLAGMNKQVWMKSELHRTFFPVWNRPLNYILIIVIVLSTLKSKLKFLRSMRHSEACFYAYRQMQDIKNNEQDIPPFKYKCLWGHS